MIGSSEIEGAMFELLAGLEEFGEPGDPLPVVRWLEQHGFDSAAVIAASERAVPAVIPREPGYLQATWVMGLAMGWVLARREGSF